MGNKNSGNIEKIVTKEMEDERNIKNKKKVADGDRKSIYGRDYEPKYLDTGKMYKNSENHTPDGKFKKGNNAALNHKKIINKLEFKNQMNQIAMTKLSAEEFQEIWDKLLGMAKKGNMNAMRLIKEYALDEEKKNIAIELEGDATINWTINFDEKKKE